MYRKIGDYGNGAARASIRQYRDFIKKLSYNKGYKQENQSDSRLAPIEKIEIKTKDTMAFTYERDLHNSLKDQVKVLFPSFNLKGSEYTIGNGRIDLLLENKKELLVIELKSGEAFAEVFGQISMYLGLLNHKYPDKSIKGMIIASKIHEGLKHACNTNPLITCKTYKMKLTLQDI